MQNTIITYSEGRGNLGKVQNKQKSWAQFKKMLSVPSRTKETFKEYSAMSLSQKLEKKRADGYFCAALCKDGSRRKENIGDRIILTLDLDENADDVLASYLDGSNPICRVESFIQTSRSHSPKHPKFRMVILLDRPIDKEEHNALSRIVASKVDKTMRSMDPVSHRMAQMMFKPTAARDGEFIFKEYTTGKALNVDKVFAAFVKKVGDWKNVANLPKNPEREDTLRDVMAKAEDPWAKDGPVGTWCRAWPIEELIAEHLSEYYFPSDDETGSEPRYTPVGSSGSSGVVVYEDGRFIYSNHTTDPIAEMNVNAWDLFRYCKFAHLDEGKTDSETPMNKMPSWKAMMDFARKEPRYKEQAIDDRYDDVDEDFNDDDVADADDGSYTRNESIEDPDTVDESVSDEVGDESNPKIVKKGDSKRLEPTEVPKKWKAKLETDKEGKIKATLPNVTQIIQYDGRMKDKLAYNEFTAEPVLKGSIKTKVPYIPTFKCENPEKGDMLSDAIDDTLRAMLAVPEHYGVNATDRDLKSGVMLTSLKRPFHPIRDLMEKYAEEWDGVERLDSVAHDYLGSPDTPYSREVFTKTMLALVGRQFEPGMTFHNMIVLQAPIGGEGKSEFCKILGMRDFHVSMQADLSDAAKIVEATRGNIVVEMDEMESYGKSSHGAMLSYLSRNEEQVRVAYAKRPQRYPRQNITIATTNEADYLRAVGGSRRFWPLKITKTPKNRIDNPKFAEEYPQILGEAANRYLAMRAEQPTGDLNLNLESPEALAEHAKMIQIVSKDTPAKELAGEIDAWVRNPVPFNELTWAYTGSRDDFTDDTDMDKTMVVRTRTCSAELKAELAARGPELSYRTSHIIGDAVREAELLERPGMRWEFGTVNSAIRHGKQTVFLSTLGDWTDKELAQGYALADSPSIYSEEPKPHPNDDLI